MSITINVASAVVPLPVDWRTHRLGVRKRPLEWSQGDQLWAARSLTEILRYAERRAERRGVRQAVSVYVRRYPRSPLYLVQDIL